MPDGIKPFGNVPDILNRIVAQQFDPGQNLIDARLAEVQTQQVRSNLLSQFLSQANLNNFSPSQIIQSIMAITGETKLVPTLTQALFEERAGQQEQSLLEGQLSRLRELSEFIAERTEEGFTPQEVGEIRAEERRLGIKETQIPAKAIIPPTPARKREREATIGFTDRFTLESIDEFERIGNFGVLVERPEWLESLKQKQVQEKEKEPVAPTEAQRKRLIKETRREIIKHPFFKEVGDTGLFDLTGIALNELARKESENAKRLLARAPEDFLVILDRYARFKFDLPFIERLRFRGQEVPTVPTLPSEISQSQIQVMSFEELRDLQKNNPALRQRVIDEIKRRSGIQ